MTIRILKGDCRDVLRMLPDESVHCVVTSPPYWGLRDYGTAKWDGGDPECDHGMERVARRNAGAQTGVTQEGSLRDKPRSECKCGARRIDNQIGLEGSFTDYIETMRNVFGEVQRVLRKDGTLWLNLGDTYASAWVCNRRSEIGLGSMVDGSRANRTDRLGSGLKEKDLCGIPWRVAFALQADGWYLRQDIIWAKPNPMPESVTDRCTKSHEYLFLLTKSERYHYDAEAIKEEWTSGRDDMRAHGIRTGASYIQQGAVMDNTDKGSRAAERNQHDYKGGRNRRSVWEIATFPYPEAHFATFPPALIEPCILAGCPEKACAKCGAPWARKVERTTEFKGGSGAAGRNADEVNANGKWAGKQYGKNIKLGPVVSSRTLGFSPSCSCNAGTVPGTVLDPFGGAGTTGLVADRLGRNAILIELNPQYADMAERRIKGDSPLFAEVL